MLEFLAFVSVVANVIIKIPKLIRFAFLAFLIEKNRVVFAVCADIVIDMNSIEAYIYEV